MKVLISWLAYKNDFTEKGGIVNKEGSPNYQFHQHFYDQEAYDKHIILSSEASATNDTRMDFLLNTLRKDFNHRIEPAYLDIKDVIDLQEIKNKCEALILKFSQHEIDIFFSPGTSAMQLAWYILHTTLGLKTRLLQTRPAYKTKKKIPELIEIKTEQSSLPVSLIIKEQSLNEHAHYEGFNDYLLTESIKPIYNQAYKIAQTETVPTLILGDSGTGKEHIAHFIHINSARKNSPFIAFNCSSMQDNLMESRLFGYTKGAFTDAKEDKPGFFEQANGGTIFLDEIGDISPYMQQALLRAIQEQEIIPVGGMQKKINVRIIAATNKNLTDLCAKNLFRWDLYYRLSTTIIELPNLIKRGSEEINLLIDYFLKKKKNKFHRRKTLKITKEARNQLLAYTYPGNIRQLENFIENLYVYCEEEIKVSNLPIETRNNTDQFSFNWEETEKQHIEKVLQYFKNNQRKAWQALGYKSLNTFKSKLKKYGIEVV
jgi:transcriptional regulator with PAS, ATPase and Fis domain